MAKDNSQPPECQEFLRQLPPITGAEHFVVSDERRKLTLPPTTSDMKVAQVLKQLLCGIMEALGYPESSASNTGL